MGTESVSILVADGHPITREGLRAALERSAALRVVAEAGDAEATLLAAGLHRPEIVVLDAGLGPGLSPGLHPGSIPGTCVGAVAALRAAHPDLRILVACAVPPGGPDATAVRAFVAAGANGIVAKTADPRAFQTAVLALVGGGAYFSNAVAAALFPAGASALPCAVASAATTGLAGAANHASMAGHAGMAEIDAFGLSLREREVLRYLSGGFSNKEVARRLGLSVRTVETHRLNLRRKTKAGRLKDLVHVARRLGLPSVDEDVAAPRPAPIAPASPANSPAGAAPARVGLVGGYPNGAGVPRPPFGLAAAGLRRLVR